MSNFFSYPWFKIDQLNFFVAIAIGVFALLTLIYSSVFMKSMPRSLQYYASILLTTIISIGAVFANNLILLLAFWGFLGLVLYVLISMGREGAELAAKKSLIIVAGSDALMIFGIAILYYFGRTLQMDQLRLELNNFPVSLAFLSIAIACFAKAGAMPMHSWIPDCAASAPLPVTAFLPASLDKLLGIYLLVRLCLHLVVMNATANLFLMVIGAGTIVCAVMMALVQHDLKRLLGYHAVSQVGYMVLGIGTGNPVGIAGGLFHMLNHAIYKSCLFFSAGNVEYRLKTSELDKLGGLAKLMPLTYISAMIASFSISGIPPFNGFISKWLIYQGLFLNISSKSSVWQLALSVFCLIAALFGSALTLASFMKLLHAVFLGQRLTISRPEEVKEVPWQMWVPCVILAFTCVLFGVFAFAIPLRYCIFPAISLYSLMNSENLIGSWRPVLTTALLISGLILGFIIFKVTNSAKSFRRDASFTGGEIPPLQEENMISGTEFYNTIKEIRVLRNIYKRAEEGFFDIYCQAKRIFCLSRLLQYLHNGVLPTYLVWVLLGMLGLFLTLLR